MQIILFLVFALSNCYVLPVQTWKQQMLVRCHHEILILQCWAVVYWNSCHPGQAENCRTMPSPCWFEGKCTMMNTKSNTESRQVNKSLIIDMLLVLLGKSVLFNSLLLLCITWEWWSPANVCPPLGLREHH